MKTLATFISLFLVTVSASAQSEFNLQGHRGCRGLLPENTIPAFLKAIELGVNTLELDVVISKDFRVIISHEPYMNYITCLDSLGKPISKVHQKEFRIYDMTIDQIRKFDCGSLPDPDFPDQQKMNVTKPLFSDMIDAVEQYVSQHNLAPVHYNIEIKSSIEGDNIFHPAPDAFIDLVVRVIQEKGITGRMNLQSFDIRPLQYLHNRYPDLKTALLISNINSLRKNIRLLGFTPNGYNPYYKLVSKKLVKEVHSRGMTLNVWTVNKEEDMRRMKSFGVDGLITDYPDRFKRL